jgi:hypothetical protein
MNYSSFKLEWNQSYFFKNLPTRLVLGRQNEKYSITFNLTWVLHCRGQYLMYSMLVQDEIKPLGGVP